MLTFKTSGFLGRLVRLKLQLALTPLCVLLTQCAVLSLLAIGIDPCLPFNRRIMTTGVIINLPRYSYPQ